MDFGLARQLASTLTQHHALLGSVEFMAPEQSVDPTAVGPAADVYGLGATLFWVLTGQLPFAPGRNVLETLTTIQTGRPRRLRDFRPDVPEEVDELFARMLARNPADRPDAVEVMRGLARFAGPEGPAGVRPGGSEVVGLRDMVRQLEGRLRVRDEAVHQAQGALVRALAKMAESHDGGTEGHPRRMQEYVRALAAELAAHPEWAVLQDTTFVAELVRCVPLHDAILNKPGPLTVEERAVVERHPVVGCEILESLAREHAGAVSFLGVARAVVRSHHERWDGLGYPDQLAGEAIPPAARLVALADVYDALRRDRADRPGLDHASAVAAMVGGAGQFDPAVLAAFRACAKQFEEVHLTVPD